MKLLGFETRLERDDCNTYQPCKFKTYAKVSLSVQDARDVELVWSSLDNTFRESIDWEEGTAFFQPFFKERWECRYQIKEKVDAFLRLNKQLQGVYNAMEESKDWKNYFEKNRKLNFYFHNKKLIEVVTEDLKQILRMRNDFIRNCIDSLTFEECQFVGVKDVYEEFDENDLIGLVSKVKDPHYVDTEVIASLESAYDKIID